MRRDTLTTILALLISVVWSATALVGLLIQQYTALTIVTPVMLIVAGFLFGLRVTKDNGVERINGKSGDGSSAK